MKRIALFLLLATMAVASWGCSINCGGYYLRAHSPMLDSVITSAGEEIAFRDYQNWTSTDSYVKYITMQGSSNPIAGEGWYEESVPYGLTVPYNDRHPQFGMVPDWMFGEGLEPTRAEITTPFGTQVIGGGNRDYYPFSFRNLRNGSSLPYVARLYYSKQYKKDGHFWVGEKTAQVDTVSGYIIMSGPATNYHGSGPRPKILIKDGHRDWQPLVSPFTIYPDPHSRHLEIEVETEVRPYEWVDGVYYHFGDGRWREAALAAWGPYRFSIRREGETESQVIIEIRRSLYMVNRRGEIVREELPDDSYRFLIRRINRSDT